MSENEGFWLHLEELVRGGEIVIDRPKGSAHPRFPEVIYPLDYGYVKGTHAMDGDGVDVWLGSEARATQTVEAHLDGMIVTVDHLERDVEIKVLLGCMANEMQTALNFHNGFSQRGMLILRR
jgi:inorganic pyrophosphatase